MLGTRHPARPWAQLPLGLLSVLVLLAFACFPAVAPAADSGEAEYEEALPTVPGKKQGKSPAKSSGGGKSGQSSTDSGSSSEPGSSGDESSDDKAGAVAPNGDGGSGKGNEGQAKGDDRSRTTANPPAGEAETEPISHDDGGNSPVVPILIALAVLAAISIGVVAMRRRGQGPGPDSSASPEAS